MRGVDFERIRIEMIRGKGLARRKEENENEWSSQFGLVYLATLWFSARATLEKGLG
jgi:hypothetical protein